MTPHIWSIVNLKGGSAKTTTSVFLAAALHSRGLRTVLVDADPQASSLRWSELGDFPFSVLGLPVRDLHRKLAGVLGDRYDVAVIDGPPLEEQAGVVYSMLRVATHVIVPMAPTMMELDRVSDVWKAAEEVEPLRDTDLSLSVLLNRVVAQAASTDLIASTLVDQGRSVLSARVPRLERYAQAFGAPVTGEDVPHSLVVDELLARGSAL